VRFIIKQEKHSQQQAARVAMNPPTVKITRYRINGNTITQGRRTRVRGKKAPSALRRTVKIFKGSNNNKLTQPYKLIVKKGD